MKRYATVAEASEAAQRLGFKSGAEYFRGYEKDPKLASTPNRFYAEDWISWPYFLGNENAINRELTSKYPEFWKAIQCYVNAGTPLWQDSWHYLIINQLGGSGVDSASLF